MPDQIVIIKERYHLHMDAVQESGLVNGDIDGMISRFYEKVGFFRWFYPYGQKNGPSAGCTDTKITVPLIDKIDNFGNNSDLAQTSVVIGIGMHDAVIIGRLG
jgi:hypothetical protein